MLKFDSFMQCYVERHAIVEKTKKGRRVYSIDPHGLGALRKWLDQFWDAALRAYADEVEKSESNKK